MEIVDDIRKTWLQGNFEHALEKIDNHEIEYPNRQFETMLIYLFQGEFDQYAQTREMITYSKIESPHRVIYLILELHRLQINAEFDERYANLTEKISNRISTLPMDDYFYFWHAIFNILRGLNHYMVESEYEKHHQFHSTALEICSEYEEYYSTNYIKIAVYNNLGEIGRVVGNIIEAEDYLKRAKKITLDTQMNIVMGEIYSQLGSAYMEQGKFEMAMDHYQEALETPYLKSIAYYRVDNLYRLFNLYDIQDKVEQMQEIYLKVQEIDAGEPIVVQGERLMKAMLLLKEQRRLQQAKAQEILLKLDEQENIFYEFQLTIKLQLIDLLLREYAEFEQDDILKEVNTYLNELEEIAKNSKSKRLEMEFIIIEARINLVQDNIEKAYDQLNKVQSMAEKQQTNQLQREIDKELNRLKEQLDQWDTTASSIHEKIKEVELNNYINHISHKYLSGD